MPRHHPIPVLSSSFIYVHRPLPPPPPRHLPCASLPASHPPAPLLLVVLNMYGTGGEGRGGDGGHTDHFFILYATHPLHPHHITPRSPSQFASQHHVWRPLRPPPVRGFLNFPFIPTLSMCICRSCVHEQLLGQCGRWHAGRGATSISNVGVRGEGRGCRGCLPAPAMPATLGNCCALCKLPTAGQGIHQPRACSGAGYMRQYSVW